MDCAGAKTTVSIATMHAKEKAPRTCTADVSGSNAAAIHADIVDVASAPIQP